MKKRTIFTPNEIIDCESYFEICLYNRQCREIARTKIDKDDLGKVEKYKWCLNSMGYAITGIQKLLHHFVLPLKTNFDVDHINGDSLDNRKNNLRYCTHHQNILNQKKSKNNTSGHKGISWNRLNKNWRTRIKFGDKNLELGSFKNKKDAIKARELAEIKYFKEFRRK